MLHDDEALRLAFFAAALAMALVCGVCLALTGGNDKLCSVIAGIAAFLAWLITFWISRNASGGGGGGLRSHVHHAISPFASDSTRII